MKIFVILSILVSLTVFAEIQNTVAVYNCQLTSSDGSFRVNSVTHGLSEKDANLRVAILRLELNEKGDFILKSQPSKVISDVQCAVFTPNRN